MCGWVVDVMKVRGWTAWERTSVCGVEVEMSWEDSVMVESSRTTRPLLCSRQPQFVEWNERDRVSTLHRVLCWRVVHLSSLKNADSDLGKQLRVFCAVLHVS